MTIGSIDVEERSQVGALHSRARTVNTVLNTVSYSTVHPVGFSHKTVLFNVSFCF